MLNPLALLAQGTTSDYWWLGLIASGALLFVFFTVFVVRQYKRCPSNKILVIYGKMSGSQAARCIHGGGAFVIPLLQDYEFLHLEPLVIEIPLEGALSLNNIRVNVPSTFTVGIGTSPVLMNNAAERLLSLADNKIRDQAQDIILGQLRLVIATLSIEEINKDREKFMSLINENVGQEVAKIGLDLINVNIRDITDESGYIDAIGKRAAAEAVNRAKVDVAEQQRDGATGEAVAVREQTVSVAAEQASSLEGEKQAEQRQRVAVAALEAQAIEGEVVSQRNIEITRAQRLAETVAATKDAEQDQRVRVAAFEATAVEGENTEAAKVADSNARLAEVRAAARRRADVATAQAREAVLIAEREQELARMSKETLAPQEIEKLRIEIAADAEAERNRRIAHGEADAILARYEAEAKGIQRVLEAKADGYRKLVEACAGDTALAPSLLMIEKLPELVAEQVKAIQQLKFEKITVWDGGRGSNGKGATADFLSSLMGSLPPMHELAGQVGVELPSALGRVAGVSGARGQTDPSGSPAGPSGASGDGKRRRPPPAAEREAGGDGAPAA
jgi:flotillin